MAWRPLHGARKNLRATANKFIGPTFGWNLPKKLFPENPRRTSILRQQSESERNFLKISQAASW